MIGNLLTRCISRMVVSPHLSTHYYTPQALLHSLLQSHSSYHAKSRKGHVVPYCVLHPGHKGTNKAMVLSPIPSPGSLGRIMFHGRDGALHHPGAGLGGNTSFDTCASANPSCHQLDARWPPSTWKRHRSTNPPSISTYLKGSRVIWVHRTKVYVFAAFDYYNYFRCAFVQGDPLGLIVVSGL